MKKNNKDEAPVNLLDLIPERRIEWEKTDAGLVNLLKVKFRHPWLVKHLIPRLKNPYFRIKLDDIGSSTWKACDGKRDVRQVGKILKEEFGEKVEPLYDRLAFFLQQLEKNRFITFRKK
ncbi:MAG: PqqD family protein [Candidatus Aminicenantes bacterium]|nr:PqqD family protein [Candidatus Aminicenantes bacterium]